MPTHLIWIAYSVSNLVALLLLWAAWKRPALARALFFLLFTWAAWTNSNTVLQTPEVYLGYAQYTFSTWYEQFIHGYFAKHIATFVLGIAAGQALIALAMLATGSLFRLGAIGGIIFLLAIAPLGVGSAFPCTLIMAVAMGLLYQKRSTHWLWFAFTNQTSPSSADSAHAAPRS